MDIAKIHTLKPTIKLFNQDPYKNNCSAKVVYVSDDIAIFDQTIFYAESGGQIFDIGYIDGNEVVDVQKKMGTLLSVKNNFIDVPSVRANSKLVHKFKNKVPFKVGDNVNMEIDWDRRYKTMKHHTLSHFLFYAINVEFYNAKIDLFLKGCSINADGSSFSLNNKVSEELFERIKNRTLEYLSKNKEIQFKPDPSTDEVFYWECDDIVIPCGGTHIKSTSEINNTINIRKKSGGKNKSKLYIEML